MHNDDINNRFDFHPATTAEKRGDHGSVRNACAELARFINEHVPDGREKSLAITKLEEAMFWANAAIARPRLEQQAADVRAIADEALARSMAAEQSAAAAQSMASQ